MSRNKCCNKPFRSGGALSKAVCRAIDFKSCAATIIVANSWVAKPSAGHPPGIAQKRMESGNFVV
jgi:hypothetical protein